MCLVAAELVASTRGLGFMIQDARYLLLTERVILGMLVIGLLGYVMDRGMRYLQWRLLPWYRPVAEEALYGCARSMQHQQGILHQPD